MTVHATGALESAGRSVLLRHDTPDGLWHHDWMILPAGAEGERPLLTFRTIADPRAGVRGFAAVRAEDHRAVYLSFEGALSGGRGRVRRVWSEPAWATFAPGGGLAVRIGGGLLDGRAVRGAVWWFQPGGRA